jgi:hypothetical protein
VRWKIRQTIPEVMADLRETSFILLEHNTHKQTMLERTIETELTPGERWTIEREHRRLGKIGLYATCPESSTPW